MQHKNRKNMKKIVWIAAAIVLMTACQESLEDRCEREAKDYTAKHCPTLVAKNISKLNNYSRYERCYHY